ncbi:MAG TPA: hypothetical protein VKP64_05195 [Mycobacteriales bacterium]|nr:hypothetical protein [Mycobacteriales bacterium]
MSALIYAAIVAMWAYFLVPMWLRRSDVAPVEAAPADTTMPGDAAFGSMSEPAPERPPAGGRVSARRLDSSPSARSHERPAGMSSAPRPRHTTDDRATPHPPDDRLARRRSVLLVLLAAQVLIVALGLAGVLPPWTALLVLAPLAAYVTHLRAEARRRAEQRRVRMQVPAESTTPVPSPAPAVRPASGPEPQLFDLAAIEAAEAASRAALRPKATGTWDPVPVPPPTYVLKSRAQSPPPRDPGAADRGRSTTPRSDGGGQHAVNH